MSPANGHAPGRSGRRRRISLGHRGLGQGACKHLKRSKGLEALSKLLQVQGAFPDHLRHRAWQLILELPCNFAAYQSLEDRGVHSAFCKLDEAFPLRGQTRARLLSVLSTLAHWTPLLAQVPYLAALAFPITQVFGAERVLTFEFMMVFFLNWGHGWLDFFPNPPIGVLSLVAYLLEASDSELFLHLTAVVAEGSHDHVVSLAVLWPWMQTLLSEVLDKQTWCALWDHLIFRWREPELFEACVVALLQSRRSALLKLSAGNLGSLDAELRRIRSNPGALELLKSAECVLTNAAAKRRADALSEQNAVAKMLSGCKKEVSLPLPRGLSYPQLQVPVYVVNKLSSEHLFVATLAKETAAANSLQVRLAASSKRLAETDQQMLEQHANLQRERSECENHLRIDAHRLTNMQHQFDERRSSSCAARLQRVSAGAEAAVERQRVCLDADVANFAEQLQLQQKRRSAGVKQTLRNQEHLDLEHQRVQRIAHRIQKIQAEEEAEHVKRVAELQQLECETLGKVRKGQLRTYDDCYRVRLDEHQRGRQKMQKLEEMANLRREVQKDLGLRALEEELQLGADLQSKALRRVELASRMFEEESSRLEEMREKLAMRAEARLLDEDKDREQMEEQEVQARRRRADLAQQLLETEESHLEREERQIFLQAQKQARERLQDIAMRDAQAAGDAEASFREALLELDEVRTAEARADLEQQQAM